MAMADAAASEFKASEPGADVPAAAGRALVPLTEAAASAELVHRNPRPDASFVVQLNATAAHAPQTRPLRRACSGTGARAYKGFVIRQIAADMVSGQALSRMA
jgi:hypothetical protein